MKRLLLLSLLALPLAAQYPAGRSSSAATTRVGRIPTSMTASG